jgi:nifR3 family TIM-barrel protein
VVLQAPLAGVTDRIFRTLVRRWAGDTLLFTDMVPASRLEDDRSDRKLAGLGDERGPVGVQLFDHRPQAMAEAARRAEALGAAAIDINMGCPVPKVARRGGGSALLREPELAARIVAAVAAAVAVPVSVKARLGWCERSADPVRLALLLQNAGARRLTIHGRTRHQGYAGQADWAAIGAVKRAVMIPVIANGDISSAADARRCLAVSGADGVMVGRATLGAPWTVGRLQAQLDGLPDPGAPPPRTRLLLARYHLEMLLQAHGPHGLLIARRHLGWALAGLPGGAPLRAALMRVTEPVLALGLLTRAAAEANDAPQGSTEGQPCRTSSNEK